MNSSRLPRTPAEPRWRRYGIHWHAFVNAHRLGDKSRSAGFDDEHHRSADPDETFTTPDEVVQWERREITRALKEAKPPWSEGARQGLDDLSDSGTWAKALRAQLEKGMSSFQTVRVSDAQVVDLTAYALSFKDCERHRG